MTSRHLSVVWRAVETAAPVGNAKEPPQRDDVAIEAYIASLTEKPFAYDWEERLRAVSPVTHPQMAFNEYRQYKDRLYDAVKILNATPEVETEYAGECVREAFWRLRAARHIQNTHNREINRGRNDFEMQCEDMEALLELAVFVQPNSSVKTRLLHDWKSGVLNLDTGRDAWHLRTNLARNYRHAIPGSEEATHYETMLRHFKGQDLRRERIAQSGLDLVRK